MVDFNRVILNGTLGAEEVWSTSIAVSFGSGSGSAALIEYDSLLEWSENVADVLGLLGTDAGGIRANLSSNGTINTVRVEYRADNILQQAAETILDPPIAGNTSQSRPFQTSLVASLITGRPGRSYRGRMYWPSLGGTFAATTNGVTDANASALAGEVAGLLRDICSAAPTVGANPVIYSPTLNAVTTVTSVQVGTGMDIQRRRADNVFETRSTVAVPSA